MQERCRICKRDALPTKKECENCYFPVAIECIDKQIRHEANMISPDYADENEVIGYECPCCGAEYEIEYDAFFKYCPECGQALKIEGVEDDE